MITSCINEPCLLSHTSVSKETSKGLKETLKCRGERVNTRIIPGYAAGYRSPVSSLSVTKLPSEEKKLVCR